MNRIERRMRNLINPYSTAFAGWWCHSGRFMTPGSRAAARSLRLRPAAQAARRAAVDELLAGMGKGDDGGPQAPRENTLTRFPAGSRKIMDRFPQG
jgi:hypothetical protein